MTHIPCTPYPQLPSVLDEFVTSIQAILSDNFVGAYLVGSLATGDFDLDSDVDFAVVTLDELGDAKVEALNAMHTRIHSLGCYPAEHLEGSYFRKDLLNQPASVGIEKTWFLNNGSTKLERSIHDNQWHVRWVVRERGIVLAGPDPKTFVDPVPIGMLRAEMVATLHLIRNYFNAELNAPLAYFSTRFGQSFTVLTCCRMLHTLHTGIVQSKRAGAEWAKRELDSGWAELIEQAWNERQGVRFCIKIRERADRHVLLRTLEFVDYAISESIQ